MLKIFVTIMLLGVLMCACGQDNDGFGRLEECYGNEVPCDTGECCPGGNVCCSDQDILMALCCPMDTPYCCKTGEQVVCSEEPCH